MISQVQELIRTLEQLPEAEQARKAEAFMEILAQEASAKLPTLAELIAEAEQEIAYGQVYEISQLVREIKNNRRVS